MSAQTQQIINAVNPAPIPAYQVPNLTYITDAVATLVADAKTAYRVT